MAPSEPEELVLWGLLASNSSSDLVAYLVILDLAFFFPFLDDEGTEVNAGSSTGSVGRDGVGADGVVVPFFVFFLPPFLVTAGELSSGDRPHDEAAVGAAASNRGEPQDPLLALDFALFGDFVGLFCDELFFPPLPDRLGSGLIGADSVGSKGRATVLFP